MLSENVEMSIFKTDFKSSKVSPQVERLESLKTGLMLICKSTNIKAGLDELSILKKLNQSNFNCFPKLIDYKMTNQSFQIYMSYIEGATVAHIINNKAKREERLQRIDQIVLSAIKALNALHNEGILHLDLKPENVIIDDHNNVFIIDFSTSIFMNRKEEINHFVGSWGYISPEVMLATSHVDESSDYFSLGKVLLELIGEQHYKLPFDLYEHLLALCSIQQEKRKEIMKDLLKRLA
ncbi:protein kinase domain-containing protein [Fusibacter bizertensis]